MSPSFPVLCTERLILREPRSSDAERLFEAAQDAMVMQYYGMPALTNRSEALEQLTSFSRLYISGKGTRWIVTFRSPSSDTPADCYIGDLGFHSYSRWDRRAEIGYRLSRRHWNQGLMTEAVSAVVAYGFRSLKLNRIQAQVDTRNQASQRVLEKAGFRIEGTLHEYERDGKDYISLIVAALLQREWQEAQRLSQPGAEIG